jgi:hypothetical protein
MASYTFYAATGDGFLASTAPDWASCQSGSGVIASDDSTTASVGTTFLDLTSVGGGYSYSAYQYFLAFPTASIPDDDTVTAATLSLWCQSKVGGGEWSVEAVAYNWGGTLETSDWRSGAAYGGLTVRASRSISAITTGQYNALASSSLAAAVSRTASTLLLVCSSQFDGISPGGYDFASFHTADQTGTTSDPKLEVTTTDTPPSGSAPQILWIL